MSVTHMRLRSLHCYIFTHHTLCAPAYIPTLHTNSYKPIQTYTQPICTYTLYTYPTLAYLPYIPTLPLQTYQTLRTYPTPTYLHYSYNHYTLLCMPVITLYNCSMSRQSGGAVAFCQWWDIMCCDIYWRNYCIQIWFVCWEPPGEGRGVEFPR